MHRHKRTALVAAAWILIITAIAKLASVGHGFGVAFKTEPLFGVPRPAFFAAAALVELLIAFVALRGPESLSIRLLAYLGALFSAYRAVNLYAGKKLCDCVGGLWDFLGMSRSVSQIASWVLLLAYLSLVGYLLHCEHSERKNEQ